MMKETMWLWVPVAALLVLGTIGRMTAPETTQAVARVLVSGELPR